MPELKAAQARAVLKEQLIDDDTLDDWMAYSELLKSSLPLKLRAVLDKAMVDMLVSRASLSVAPRGRRGTAAGTCLQIERLRQAAAFIRGGNFIGSLPISELQFLSTVQAELLAAHLHRTVEEVRELKLSIQYEIKRAQAIEAALQSIAVMSASRSAAATSE
jgi:hypothetical protein